MNERRKLDRRCRPATAEIEARPDVLTPFGGPLPGLVSKAIFRDRTAHALSRAARTQDRVALVVLDVGSSTGGEREVRSVAAEVIAQVRDQDTVTWLDDSYVGILAEGIDGIAGAQQMRRRLSDAVARCRASSVAIADADGRIHSWFGDARESAVS